MKNTNEKVTFDYFKVDDKEDISESVNYLKRVFGSVMDVIFEEDNHQDTNCKNCRKK